ncbi:tRNA threonylcarbamoyladenosine biosynthesis protein SUA5 [Syntrophomonas zehnderi OL-4]|uniref:Threonylcarbamoyl-AMP synthase n=1 Tax=Syntrophomonas zehnderi OL-4 TaxID=690567 RepID=A0A0E4C7K5_9FIRM|nr:L-threonylcarbamoyladenylate synthase [Syntrophomonas zehnderi]CFX02674.1 tRNA threonylcarbamoyladenosine biosynthesis protein SUA5 [Syntrophomonas zehnderi OL-4]
MFKTRYFTVDPDHPDPTVINQAAGYIRTGELLAFPTETVYGLGADALNAGAVEKIFIAKGRPADHPLLIHVSRVEQVEALALVIPAAARRLIGHFWPGPLSIILPSRPQVPGIVRGNKSGVGFRMPSHPVSIALLNETGPLAAPSANLYGRPSPTNAEHVRQDMDGRIAAVLDAGETGNGLESTIIDFCEGIKVIRRGGIALEEIEDILGQGISLNSSAQGNKNAYDLKVKVLLSEGENDFYQQMEQCLQISKLIGVVRIIGRNKPLKGSFHQEYFLDLTGRGNSWFAILRDAEQRKLDYLLVEPLDQKTEGISASIMDRIKRAAALKPK